MERVSPLLVCPLPAGASPHYPQPAYKVGTLPGGIPTIGQPGRYDGPKLDNLRHGYGRYEYPGPL